MGIDYTSYSDQDSLTYDTATVDEFANDIVEPIKADEPEPNEEVSEDSKIIKVANAKKVYIRETPSKDGNQLAVVAKDAELMVIGYSQFDDNDDLWHNVCTESGIEGYVMAKFTIE